MCCFRCKVNFILVLCIFTHKVLSNPSSTTSFPLATTDSSLTYISNNRYDDNTSRESRGMMMMMDDEHKDHHPVEEQKAVKEDPWAGYYDFIINEGSFKFWAVFQVVTAVLLIYSAFAAVYYAKFNVITTDYADYFYDDDFFARSNNDQPYSSIWGKFSAQTLQRIFDALSSKKFS